MISKYLNSNPVPWLTDGADPAAAYLTKKEFCRSSDDTVNYRELEISALSGYFRKFSMQNILGDKKNPDLVNRGTVWYFLWAVACGYDSRTDFIRDTAEFILEKFYTKEGGFSLSIDPLRPLACRTGDLVRAMLKAGINNQRTTAGLQWISGHQRHDGGWLHCPFNGLCDIMKMFLFKKAGTGMRRENDKRIPSCPVATLSCIRALSSSGMSEYQPVIEAGAMFLLRSSSLSHADKILYCGLSLQPQKPGYPVMTQFDSITALIEVFKTTLWNNPLCAEAFNNIIRRQTAEGTWKLENNTRGMIPGKKGENRLVTLNVLRLLERLAEKESQFEKA